MTHTRLSVIVQPEFPVELVSMMNRPAHRSVRIRRTAAQDRISAVQLANEVPSARYPDLCRARPVRHQARRDCPLNRARLVAPITKAVSLHTRVYGGREHFRMPVHTLPRQAPTQSPQQSRMFIPTDRDEGRRIGPKHRRRATRLISVTLGPGTATSGSEPRAASGRPETVLRRPYRLIFTVHWSGTDVAR